MQQKELFPVEILLMFNLDHEVEGCNVMDQPAFHPGLGSREALDSSRINMWNIEMRGGSGACIIC